MASRMDKDACIGKTTTSIRDNGKRDTPTDSAFYGSLMDSGTKAIGRMTCRTATDCASIPTATSTKATSARGYDKATAFYGNRAVNGTKERSRTTNPYGMTYPQTRQSVYLRRNSPHANPLSATGFGAKHGGS